MNTQNTQNIENQMVISENIGLTIGFSEKFYTLWNVTKNDIYSTRISANGEQHFKSGERVICQYIKNISFDLNKVQQKFPNVPINDQLRGQTRSFEYNEGKKFIEYCDDVFSIGFNRGQAIEKCDELTVLKWSFSNETSETRLENIKKQMVVLGMFEFNGIMFDDQNEMYQYKSNHQKRLTIEKISKQILNDCVDCGKHVVEFVKNLNEYGRYYDNENGVYIMFKDFKLMSYNGFEYGIPTINGKGKKIKGKKIELICQTIVDPFHNECQILLVSDFKIID